MSAKCKVLESRLAIRIEKLCMSLFHLALGTHHFSLLTLLNACRPSQCLPSRRVRIQ